MNRNLKWHGSDEELRRLMDAGKLVDENEWTYVGGMEKYTAITFIEKARFYLFKSPSDLVQAAEKIWFAAVYAVKKLYLSCGRIDLKSHNSLSYFCDFAIYNLGLSYKRCRFLWNCWQKAQEMHQCSGNFHSGEYAQIILDVEVFVRELEGFDCKKLWSEFEKMYISQTNPRVKVEKTTGIVKLGGNTFEIDYSVYV